MPAEKVQFAGRYLTLTTEEKGTVVYERVYSRNGVTVIVEPSPGVLRFVNGTRWDEPENLLPLVVSAYLEDGEDPLSCAKRELLEELGATATQWSHYLTSRWKGTVIKTQEYFLAREITQGVARPNADEDIRGYVDLTFDEVKRAVLELTFGTNENAFALLKYITEIESS